MFVSLEKNFFGLAQPQLGRCVSPISVKTQNLKLNADHLVNRWNFIEMINLWKKIELLYEIYPFRIKVFTSKFKYKFIFIIIKYWVTLK